MFVCLFPLPTCTNKTIKEWWYGTVGAWIFDLSSQTPFQLTNSLLKNFPRLMKGAHPNHHRIILLCNGGNIDYPKRYCKNSESPTQFPTKRGRFNSFISSQWVSSYCFTNHRPNKLCRKPPRSPGRRQPQQPDSVVLVFGESTGMGPGQGKGYLYVY